eukprot:2860212-Amphidinium_carterae.1
MAVCQLAARQCHICALSENGGVERADQRYILVTELKMLVPLFLQNNDSCMNRLRYDRRASECAERISQSTPACTGSMCGQWSLWSLQHSTLTLSLWDLSLAGIDSNVSTELRECNDANQLGCSEVRKYLLYLWETNHGYDDYEATLKDVYHSLECGNTSKPLETGLSCHVHRLVHKATTFPLVSLTTWHASQSAT